MLDDMDAEFARIAAAHPSVQVVDWSTKSKLGSLRVHFDLLDAPRETWSALRAPVERAEERSVRTCERCGLLCRTRDVSGWLTTLCDDHARTVAEL